VVGPIISGDPHLRHKVLPNSDCLHSALYVVDLVRFRQMAAGVCQAFSLGLRITNLRHSL
jgi:hypothetical protein